MPLRKDTIEQLGWAILDGNKEKLIHVVVDELATAAADDGVIIGENVRSVVTGAVGLLIDRFLISKKANEERFEKLQNTRRLMVAKDIYCEMMYQPSAPPSPRERAERAKIMADELLDVLDGP